MQWVIHNPIKPLIHEAPALAWIAAVLAAIAGLAATLALYRGLQIGRVGAVSPVAEAYGAVTAILEIISGESLRPAVIARVAMIVGGALLVAAPAKCQRSFAGTGN